MIQLEKHINRLKLLCTLYNVEKMYLFGSALNSNFNDTSDIDLLVKFKPIELSLYFDNYINFKEKLESLFGRNVDLLEEQTLKNPILINSINKNKELIYGWKNSKMVNFNKSSPEIENRNWQSNLWKVA